MHLSQAKQIHSHQHDLLKKLDYLTMRISSNLYQQNQGAVEENLPSQKYGQLLKEKLKVPQEDKITRIRKGIIGLTTTYISALHIEVESVYVDHTATNRAFRPIEDIISNLKLYAANPHTEFSYFGKYSTDMMQYAHNSILNSLGGSLDQFVALPTGSGSTGAIQKAIKIVRSLQNEFTEPSIFITPYQHHSNILPWIEFYGNVNILASDQNSNLLLQNIEKQLLEALESEVIVSASAASNMTSKITDLGELNSVIKRVRKSKKVLFAVDCAAYCCHHQLNLQVLDQIDLVFLSPHKNLGGTESCGVLVARRSIIKNAKPTFPGGGTVSFVKGYSKQDITYDIDIFNREIAGTPPFIGFYRAALSFQLLKKEVTYGLIHQRESMNTNAFLKEIADANSKFKSSRQNRQILIYGDTNFDFRANVIILNLLSKGKLLQHSFVSLLLTDIFGIQIRSGCFCAGPFGLSLLKLDHNAAKIIQQEVSAGILRSKPGYLRLDLTFYLEPFEVQYIAQAIIAIAEFGENMSVIYTICNDGEIKRHKAFKSLPPHEFNLSKLMNQNENKKIVEGNRLANRKTTLQKQFKRGLLILQNPIQFLKAHFDPLHS